MQQFEGKKKNYSYDLYGNFEGYLLKQYNQIL